MFRFLRRVFIILVLFIIVFFIFRLVKPEATSRFVDRVKTIPTTISSRFHREKKSNIIINGDTTSTRSNFEINTNNNTNNEDYDGEDEQAVINKDTNEINNGNNGELDQSWLEELNKELDKILASGNTQSQGEADNRNAEELISGLIKDSNIEIVELTGNNQDKEFIVIDVEQPYEPEVKNSTSTTTNTTTTITTTTTNTNTQTTANTQTTTNNTKNNYKAPQRGDCGEGLTVQDCEDLIRDLGNLNFN